MVRNDLKKSGSKQVKLIKKRFEGNSGDRVTCINEVIKSNQTVGITQKPYGIVWTEGEGDRAAKESKKTYPIFYEDIFKRIGVNNFVNLIIEGENFDALRILSYTHRDKNGRGLIDIIYIDPPYNIDHDSYDDSFEHGDWLSRIYKRLVLAKRLLAKTGIICISIDEEELHPLKLICDEIFFRENHVTTLKIRMRNENRQLNAKSYFQKSMEYLLIYAKDINCLTLNKNIVDVDFTDYKYKIMEKSVGTKRIIKNKEVYVFKNGEYEIIKCDDLNDKDILKSISIRGTIKTKQNTGKFYEQNLRGLITVDGIGTLYKVMDMGDDDIGYRYIIHPGKNTINGVYYQGIPVRHRDDMENAVKEQSLSDFYDFSEENLRSGNIQKWIFGRKVFGTPKPVELIKFILNLIPNKNATILDFYAGCGTTGQAVLELNKLDGGNRKFILCNWNEIERNSKLHICSEICYPIIKAIIKGYDYVYKGKKYSVEGTGGNVRYMKIDYIHSTSKDKESSIFSSNLDKYYEALNDKSTVMICIKENCFTEVKITDAFKIFTNGKRYVGILNKFGEIKAFKKEMRELQKSGVINKNNKMVIYTFSYGNVALNVVFKDVLDICDDIVVTPYDMINVWRGMINV